MFINFLMNNYLGMFFEKFEKNSKKNLKNLENLTN